MSEKVWREAWENNHIGFHKNKINPLLISYFDRLNLCKGACVFVPLCGKTLDIGWLLSNGYQVIGSELSELAIQQLFFELDIIPKITDVGKFKRYSAENIDIYVGNIFALTKDLFKNINAVFDRGGLVALPENIRIQYTQHITNLTSQAPQLLIVYEYNQNLMNGPPFSIGSKEVDQHYNNIYKISLISSQDTLDIQRNAIDIKENIFLLN